ncbi:hypothetical protein ERJ75_000905300 [Trypanosoma vivax]|nr:hypothetical protein ERJ75_000905300 [Trypanosoma vivax]
MRSKEEGGRSAAAVRGPQVRTRWRRRRCSQDACVGAVRQGVKHGAGLGELARREMPWRPSRVACFRVTVASVETCIARLWALDDEVG